MNLFEQIITIATSSLATVITRFLPFALFNEKGRTPKVIDYLGKALPPAIFAMLVVYCLRSVDWTSSSAHYGLPELISLCLTILIHLWRKNMMLSMFLGTLCYMLLVQFVFV